MEIREMKCPAPGCEHVIRVTEDDLEPTMFDLEYESLEHANAVKFRKVSDRIEVVLRDHIELRHPGTTEDDLREYRYKTTRVAFSIEAHIDNMTLADVWPDGDGPNDPTAADVAAKMMAEGTKMGVLQEWCLLDDVTVHVSVDYGPEAEVWTA